MSSSASDVYNSQIQKSDAMAMRMMLSTVTIPGEGNDILKMLLEVTEEGRVLSNGQRIR